MVARWQDNRLAQVPLLKRCPAPAAPFVRKYTDADIALLVEMDRANEDVCGSAIAHLLKRAYITHGDKRHERLSRLCVSHLHNLRKSNAYQAQRVSFNKTLPVCNPIGVQSNDNALAESKNNSVVRKHMGYSHIPQRYAKPINDFFENTFNSWLNMHRPCLFESFRKEMLVAHLIHRRIASQARPKTPASLTVSSTCNGTSAATDPSGSDTRSTPSACP